MLHHAIVVHQFKIFIQNLEVFQLANLSPGGHQLNIECLITILASFTSPKLYPSQPHNTYRKSYN